MQGSLTTRQSLYEALDARGDGAEDRKRFDDAVWAAVGLDASVLVTDLSGFTRLTRQHGVLHFLSIVRRFTLACTPIMTKHGGSLVCHEADDVIGLFSEPKDAVHAALEMLAHVRELNRALKEEDRIGLSIGIEHGRILRLSDDVFGDAVNLAYKLGEDLAGLDECLVGRTAFDLLQQPTFPGCTVSPLKDTLVSGVSIEHRSIRLLS
jgi:class 3 adenylate cyclase